MSSLIEVKNLSVEFKTDNGKVEAVRDISFNIQKGKTVGLVGESGSGKSVTALSIMRLIPDPPGSISGGQIFMDTGQRKSNQDNEPTFSEKKEDILKLPESSMRRIRGNRISMIFQEPMSSLNPVFTVGNQISEALILHRNMNKKSAWEQSIELLNQVEVDNPGERVKSYPHQLSGGQRQRVMIAMAIACNPDLLIADEPTTALDVTIQQQIMELLMNLQKQYAMSVLFITHNLGLIAEIANEVLVMYKGRIVEQNTTVDIFKRPSHPYTKGLMACRPTLDKNSHRLPVISDYMDEQGKALNPGDKWGAKKMKSLSSKGPPLLEVKNLKKHFPLKKNVFGTPQSWIKAVDDVSFTVRKGETLGLVGESGCGKTTLGRVILRLLTATAGDILYHGQNIMLLSRKEMQPLRRKMQVIFQDPYASLNPRMTIGSAIMEPMIIHNLGEDKQERIKKTEQLLERVGLTGDMLHRYPHEFSGGQRQRVCIARALAVQPEFIICDESVSALDVSIQSQIINLLLDLQEEMELTYIFISHDLAVVKFISDEVCVMNKGKIIEKNTYLEIYKNPKEDYTKKLLNSIPVGIPSETSPAL
ncbi:MAG: ABC transporter ATP-binding protein [Bdellovibrionales bacterium]|nr:ABC transporter ATP-binding protein [Bdellovibrionales bacterium]